MPCMPSSSICADSKAHLNWPVTDPDEQEQAGCASETAAAASAVHTAEPAVYSPL